MFVDSVVITLTAGKGGNGVVAWRREKFIPKGGPAGGDGGKGGSIILKTEPGVLSLEGFRNNRIIQADHGQAGGGALKQGKGGQDLTLLIPKGTLVKDSKTKDVLFDFTKDHQEWLICKGGKGGRGNARFKSSTNQAPNICTEGTSGESYEVELELKLIADVGFIGMPNAGKSTLMEQITHVPVKIGAYPFTTLYPNLGYVQFEDFSRVLVADIPGIIEDAHENKGLGIAFLRHIERSSVLVYLIDISGFEGRDPLHDFEILRSEVEAYSKEILNKPFLVALNKTDIEGSEEHIDLFRSRYPSITPYPISALNGEGLKSLIEAMRKLAQVNGKRF